MPQNTRTPQPNPELAQHLRLLADRIEAGTVDAMFLYTDEPNQDSNFGVCFGHPLICQGLLRTAQIHWDEQTRRMMAYQHELFGSGPQRWAGNDRSSAGNEDTKDQRPS